MVRKKSRLDFDSTSTGRDKVVLRLIKKNSDLILNVVLRTVTCGQTISMIHLTKAMDSKQLEQDCIVSHKLVVGRSPRVNFQNLENRND